MKKTIIISAMALCISFTGIQANNNNIDNVTVETVVKVSPFCVSIAKGDIETVKKLIELGTDVNQKSNGLTPAMYAAKFNRTEILKLLIAKGANLKAKSDKKMTAAKYAEIHGAEEAGGIIKEALSKK